MSPPTGSWRGASQEGLYDTARPDTDDRPTIMRSSTSRACIHQIVDEACFRRAQPASLDASLLA